jgi:hypothetical protein
MKSNELQLSKSYLEWAEWGTLKEHEFVKKHGKMTPPHGRKILTFAINPKKNLTGPDLTVNGHECELKSVGTQFNSAWRKYKVKVDYAITLNVRQWQRCQLLYPDLYWVFWLAWNDEVYACNSKSLKAVLDKAKVHTYNRPKHVDQCTESFVFDARELTKLTDVIASS